MALREWDKIDTFTEEFPTYNCAFLDILGYKQRAVEFFDQRFNLYGRINRALNTVAIAQALTAPLLDISAITVEIISDSIIILQPARAMGLATILSFACHFASTLSFEGLFLRGGIAQGRHCRRKTEQGFEFLASEAFQKAYLLECEKAINPRVLIDADLIGSIISEVKPLILREGSDYILDFAHHVINREGKNSKSVHAEMTDIQSEIKRQTSDKTRSQLQWVLDYYYWTISQNPKWDAPAFAAFKSDEDRHFARLE
jgi:hypothetical protein